MMISELKNLENRIRSGEWQPQRSTKLWGGADVIIRFELTEELREWESDNHLVIDFSGFQPSANILVISKYAKHISALFYELKEIFHNYIDFANKYTFYGRLAKRAKKYIATSDDLKVLLEIINEASLMAHSVEGKLYFAYGSNMDESQMAYRCPTAQLVGKVRLDGYKFIINHRGVASIIRSDDSYVDGILWSVFPEDEKALDRYEGISSNFYFKTEICVKSLETGKHSPVIVYIASDNSFGEPRPGYLEKIIRAADKFKFDSKYSAELESWLS